MHALSVHFVVSLDVASMDVLASLHGVSMICTYTYSQLIAVVFL